MGYSPWKITKLDDRPPSARAALATGLWLGASAFLERAALKLPGTLDRALDALGGTETEPVRQLGLFGSFVYPVVTELSAYCRGRAEAHLERRRSPSYHEQEHAEVEELANDPKGIFG